MAELSLSETEIKSCLSQKFNLKYSYFSGAQSPAYKFLHPVSVLIIFQCYNLLLWENTQLDSVNIELTHNFSKLYISSLFKILLQCTSPWTAFTIFLFSMFKFFTIIEDCF